MPALTAGLPGAARVQLDGELTIYRAAELKQVLLAPLAGGAALELDLSQVTEIDTAGVQLLLLARRTAEAGGAALRLAGHSPAVREVLELLDLAAGFGVSPGAAPCASSTHSPQDGANGS